MVRHFHWTAKILARSPLPTIAAAGRSVSLTLPVADEKAWEWPVRVQKLSGGNPIQLTLTVAKAR